MPTHYVDFWAKWLRYNLILVAFEAFYNNLWTVTPCNSLAGMLADLRAEQAMRADLFDVHRSTLLSENRFQTNQASCMQARNKKRISLQRPRHAVERM